MTCAIALEKFSLIIREVIYKEQGARVNGEMVDKYVFASHVLGVITILQS